MRLDETAGKLLRKAKSIDIFETRSGEVLDIIIMSLCIEFQAKEVLKTNTVSERERREAERALKFINEVKKEIVRQYILGAHLTIRQHRGQKFFEYKLRKIRGIR